MWNRSEDSIFSEGRHYSIAVMLMLMAMLAMVALATLAIFASSAKATAADDQYGDGKTFVVGTKKLVGVKNAAHDQYGAGNDVTITTPKEAKEGVLSETIPKAKVLPDTGGGGVVVPLPALGVLTLIIGGAASGLLFVRRR